MIAHRLRGKVGLSIVENKFVMALKKSEFSPGVSWPGFIKLFVKMIRLVRTRLC